jgi:hypothetical protein
VLELAPTPEQGPTAHQGQRCGGRWSLPAGGATCRRVVAVQDALAPRSWPRPSRWQPPTARWLAPRCSCSAASTRRSPPWSSSSPASSTPSRTPQSCAASRAWRGAGRQGAGASSATTLTDIDAVGLFVVEEIGGSHLEKSGERLEVALCRVVADPLAQLPDIGPGDLRAAGLLDRLGDLSMAVRPRPRGCTI